MAELEAEDDDDDDDDDEDEDDDTISISSSSSSSSSSPLEPWSRVVDDSTVVSSTEQVSPSVGGAAACATGPDMEELSLAYAEWLDAFRGGHVPDVTVVEFDRNPEQALRPFVRIYVNTLDAVHAESMGVLSSGAGEAILQVLDLINTQGEPRRQPIVITSPLDDWHEVLDAATEDARAITLQQLDKATISWPKKDSYAMRWELEEHMRKVNTTLRREATRYSAQDAPESSESSEDARGSISRSLSASSLSGVPPAAQDYGHLFIMKGDITAIAADAWLLPTNRELKVEPYWNFPPERVPSKEALPSSWHDHNLRVVRALPDPDERGNQAYLTNVGGDVAGISEASWFIDGAVQFLQVVADDIQAAEAAAAAATAELDTARQALHSEPLQGGALEAAQQTIADLEARAAELKSAAAPCYRRCKPLVLLPLVGTGKGNAKEVIGELLTQMIQALIASARHLGIDVGLVLHSDAMFAAAQHVRKRLGKRPWREFGRGLDEVARKRLHRHARYLGKLSREGLLSLFIGAGVSFGAGLPLWGELIRNVATEAGCSEEEQREMNNMNFLDSARLINRMLKERMDPNSKTSKARRRKQKHKRKAHKSKHIEAKQQKIAKLFAAEGDSNEEEPPEEVEAEEEQEPAPEPPQQPGPVPTLGTLVAKQLREAARRCAPQHALLASIPAHEVITTNYDQLFEVAREGAGCPVRVIPTKPKEDAPDHGWLLKMHGCVTKPDEIVLSREDYQEYDMSRSALSGIVQASLLTKHILFVGFSLTDYNFHKIIGALRMAHQMRRANDDVNGDNEADMPLVGPSLRPRAHSRTNFDTVQPGSSRRYGSALMLVHDKLLAQLWDEELRLVAMVERDESVGPVWKQFGEAARSLEIFLDSVASHSCDSSVYLLDARYEHMMSRQEVQFHRFMETFYREVPTAAKKSDCWPVFQRLYALLGGVDEAVLGPNQASLINTVPADGSAELGGSRKPRSKLRWADDVVERAYHSQKRYGQLLKRVLELMSREERRALEVAWEPPTTPGHVFIVQSDIRTLGCDAWLCPSSSSFRVSAHWIRPRKLGDLVAGIVLRRLPRVHQGDADLGVRCMYVENDSESPVARLDALPDEYPKPYLTCITGSDPNKTLDAVQQFLAIVHNDLVMRNKPPRNGRGRHLIAVPAVGTGGGGLRGQTGLIINMLLRVLHVAAERYCFDLVFVAYDAPTYSAAQLARLTIQPSRALEELRKNRPVHLGKQRLTKREKRDKANKAKQQRKKGSKRKSKGKGKNKKHRSRRSKGSKRRSKHWAVDDEEEDDDGEGEEEEEVEAEVEEDVEEVDKQQQQQRADDAADSPFRALSADNIAEAKKLGERAARGELVLFFSSRHQRTVPQLQQVLQNIARADGVGAEELSQLRELSLIDQARFVAARVGHRNMVELVVAAQDVIELPLFHTLLANMPGEQAITSGQDVCFERCAAVLEKPFGVLRSEGADKLSANSRWILKLNGTIEDPSSIVLTRDDVVNAQQEQAVLGGIIKSLLVTKHIAFIGASLRDPQLLSALDASRHMLDSACTNVDDAVCTVVTPSRNDVLRQLWEPQVKTVCVGDKFIPLRHRPRHLELPHEMREAVRKMDVFLDCMVAYASVAASTTRGHLLDARFAFLWTDRDRLLSEHVDNMLTRFPPEAYECRGFDELMQTLSLLGLSQSRLRSIERNGKSSKDADQRQADAKVKTMRKKSKKEKKKGRGGGRGRGRGRGGRGRRGGGGHSGWVDDL